ncbi:sensor domain-containing protein [Cobetia sp. L2A1]|uniref:sensor domain-containing protein n=1 Tax=Cobetia sp. L2A1 TaxID=2686360 RepID=UPI00131BCEE5|nr:EAL domain-containing protein [Cobetia sp. L2A1]
MSHSTLTTGVASMIAPPVGQEELESLRLVVQHTTNGVCCYGMDGRIRWVNPAFELLMGYTATELVGRVPSEMLMGPESNPLVIARLREQRSRGEASDEELVHYHASGRSLRLRLHCIPLLAADGTPQGYLGLQTDVTQTHQVQALSQSQLTLLEAVAAGQPLEQTLMELCIAIEGAATQVLSSLLLLDEAGECIASGVSPQLPESFMSALRGVRIGEGVGTCGTSMWRRERVLTTSLATDSAWEGFRHHPAALGLEACLSMPILDSAGNSMGSFAFYSESGDALDANHQSLLEVAVNVASLAIERHRRDKQLTHQALHDALTGLPNRRLLRQHLAMLADKALDCGEIGALMLLDLDHFKRLNDVLGHDAGDRALIQIASRLEQMIEPGDMLARHGGDEFIVLLAPRPGSMLEGMTRAREVGENMLQRLREPLVLDGRTHQLSGSLGISLYPEADAASRAQPVSNEVVADEDDAWGHLLHEADIALYESKSAGRARLCFFCPEMRHQIIAATRMEQALRHALSHQRLSVHLQPQFILPATGAPYLVAAEALLRWNDPVLGNISPAIFIPVAEESGLIVELGHWVLEQVCMALADMTVKGRTLPMSVNVSQVQFRSVDFVPRVAGLLKRHAFSPDLLRIELTESLEDEDDVLEKIDQLAALGLSFSIDDFGTGYSNLARLRRMPLSELKIDRSFINDLVNEGDVLDARVHSVAGNVVVSHGNEIVRAMLVMAQALSLEVVAEGVEEEYQLEVLRQLGCQRVQGFLLGRPQPMGQLIEAFEAKQLA